MRKFKHLLSAVLAGILTISMTAPVMGKTAKDSEQLSQTFVFEQPDLLKGVESSNQLTSNPETVYINSFNATNRSTNFNEHWRFYMGEARGAEAPTYNDSQWRDLNLPHDYSIEQEFTTTGEAESGYLLGGIGWYRKTFTLSEELKNKKVSIDFGGAYMNATVWLNGTKLGTHPYGYTSFAFELPNELLNYGSDNVIAVQTNNQIPSSRWYSGSGIYRDVHMVVTDPIHVARYGTSVTTPNLESQKDGAVTVNISTSVENQDTASASVSLRHTVYKKGGTASVGTATTTAKTVLAGETMQIEGTLSVNNPDLWDIYDGNMYYVRTEVLVNNAVRDTYDTDFGFRYFEFDSNTGFSLNGNKVKLKGVCMHHDQGALGAEAWERATERQVEILADMGVNAIRVTHNPAGDALINACNEQGILVIDEAFDTWSNPKNGNSNDFAKWFKVNIEEGNTIMGGKPGSMTWAEFDTKTMVARGKNAPSIIMWSLGNEIVEGISGNSSDYPTIAQNLIEWTQEIDTSRPITFGDNQLKNDDGKANTENMIAVATAIANAGGVIGFNYANANQMATAHKNFPDWKIYGSETVSAVNSRGVYDRKGNAEKTNDGLLTSYDKSAVGWGAVASNGWYRAIINDFDAGEFVWTGFDYIGEPTPWNGTSPGAQGGKWPVTPKSSFFGIIETTGFPKDSFYFYQSQWNDKVKTLHMLPTWNPSEIMVDTENNNVEVVVYSDAPKVKLEFIDASNNVTDLGTKEFTKKTTTAGFSYQIYEGAGASATAHQNLYLTWQVPYAEGTVKATALDENNNPITNTEGRSSITTTGAAAKLVASADRNAITADGKDLSYITIDVQDTNNNFVNGAEPEIKLNITGDGTIVGVDNGSQPDHTSYQSTTRKAHRGKLLAIVQSTKANGSFTLTATADGLDPASATVATEGAAAEETTLQSYKMSRNYFIKLGTELTLPETVETKNTDGTTATSAVKWEAIPSGALSKPGTFILRGTIEDTSVKVSVNVTVIDSVAALLNYSTGVTKGGQITLPPTRPAVNFEGIVLQAEFPVVWENVPAGASNTAGIVTVKGAADVFGKAYEVIATIRVSDETITLGGNVATNAAALTAMPAGTGNLETIRNNDTTQSEWSGSGEIKFRYDTAQSLGQVKLYFTGTAPAQNEISLAWSPDDNEWNTILTTGVDTPYANGILRTYTFNLVPAVLFKVKLESNVSLAEAELIVGTSNFALNSSTAITSMKVNGEAVDSDSLKNKRFETPAYFVKEFEAESADNASITMLPMADNIVRVLTESEDHLKHDEYLIVLYSDPAIEIDPADASKDYPYAKTTATAASEQPLSETNKTEGSAAFAVDNKSGTMWHTAWTTPEGFDTDVEQRWIQLELDDETTLDSLRYYPRSGGGNGTITEYRVDVSTDGTTFGTVSEGSWPLSGAWKIAMFDEPIAAKYVRLYGVETWADGEKNNKYVSAREVRVCVPKETIDISEAEITLEQNSFDYTGSEIKPKPVATLDGTELEYGMDYIVRYTNNIEPGRATITIEGIRSHSGKASADFTILEKKSDSFTVSFDTNGGDEIAPMSVKAGNTVSLPTPSKAGKYTFLGWFADNLDGEAFTDATPVTKNITLYAKWKKNSDSSDSGSSGGDSGGSSSGGSSSGGSTSGGSSNNDTTNKPTLETLKPIVPDKSGNVTIPDSSINDAIAKAEKDATKNNTLKNGIAVVVPVEAEKDQASLNVTIDAKSLEKMLDKNIVTIDMVAKDMISYSFNKEVIEQIQKQSEGNNVNVQVKKVITLPPKASPVIGSRPVFNIQIEYTTANGESKIISDFDGENITLKLPYTPTANEEISNLCAVYVDDEGNVSMVKDSEYDKEEKAVVFKTSHFSIYGIGDKTLIAEAVGTSSISVFTDIENHWAKKDIEFTVEKGMLAGTSSNTFGPDVSMTRGMFVTALGRLAKADISTYTSSSFADVKADAYYMGYIEWANKNGIVTGFGNGEFAPDKAITRQEMAVIMVNYAKTMNNTISATVEAAAFADENVIGSWALEAVKTMQKAGILSGRGNNTFDPIGTATRAEVSSVLHRFVLQAVDTQSEDTQ